MACDCQNLDSLKTLKIIDEKDYMLNKVIEKHKDSKGSLIPVLHDAQEIYGYLPSHVQEKIAAALNIPLAEIFGVITFYNHFSLEPKGKYRVSVCMGTACYVKGAGEILLQFSERLGIRVGETTVDSLFTLEECRCLGACGLAPVLTVNSKVYGSLTVSDVDSIIKTYREMEAATRDKC